MRAEPNSDTHGPILASFSNPSTNSAIILNICQESVTFISCQSLFSNALLILSSLVILIVKLYIRNSKSKSFTGELLRKQYYVAATSFVFLVFADDVANRPRNVIRPF